MRLCSSQSVTAAYLINSNSVYKHTRNFDCGGGKAVEGPLTSEAELEAEQPARPAGACSNTKGLEISGRGG